jgi:hypothetical protein
LDRLLDLKRIELTQIEEHQAYKISKLLAQKTFFSHAFSRVRTRAVSRVIHKVGIAFLSGSNASIFDLVHLLESSSFTKPVSLAWIMDKKSKE